MGFSKLGNLNLVNQRLLLPAALLSLTAAMTFHARFKRPEIKVSKQQSAINVSNNFLKMLAIGNKRLIADVIWIQTLIESDLEAYKGDPLNSWMYLRFNNIAELDPLFYENYLFGGQYLAIVKDDREGASQIMARGLKYYPDDYGLNFNQGFNYYFQLGDVKNGLIHLEKIQDHPKALKFTKSLVIKLKHQLQPDPKLTISMLKEAYDGTSDRILREKLASDIYALKAEIDLECLNSKKENCDAFDARGEPYILKNGVYESSRPFKKYQIYKNEQ